MYRCTKNLFIAPHILHISVKLQLSTSFQSDFCTHFFSQNTSIPVKCTPCSYCFDLKSTIHIHAIKHHHKITNLSFINQQECKFGLTLFHTTWTISYSRVAFLLNRQSMGHTYSLKSIIIFK